MIKLIALLTSGLVSLGAAGLMMPEPQGPDGPTAKKKGEAGKKKGEPGPPGDMRKAYDLLRRIKADGGPAGRPEERLREWTDKATSYYRRAVQSYKDGEERRAHELGVAAHDLARAVDHSRNASRFDRPDPDLPEPPDGPGMEGDRGPLRRDLRRAYDRIGDADIDGPEARYYLDAARDLYNAARRDAERDRSERALELARAAEAMSRVPEHLARAEGPGFAAEPKRKRESGSPEAKEKRDRPEPKAKRERPDDDSLPPALPPR